MKAIHFLVSKIPPKMVGIMSKLDELIAFTAQRGRFFLLLKQHFNKNWSAVFFTLKQLFPKWKEFKQPKRTTNKPQTNHKNQRQTKPTHNIFMISMEARPLGWQGQTRNHPPRGHGCHTWSGCKITGTQKPYRSKNRAAHQHWQLKISTNTSTCSNG